MLPLIIYPAIERQPESDGFPFRISSQKRKRHGAPVAFSIQLEKIRSDGFFSQPIAKMEILFNFSALVTMFKRFFGLIISFSEGIFGVPHCFTDYFQCPGHSSMSFLEDIPSVKDANGPLRVQPTVHWFWHRLLQTLITIRPTTTKVIQRFFFIPFKSPVSRTSGGLRRGNPPCRACGLP